MQWLKACLNYKVLIGIAAVIIVAYLFAPQLASHSWLLLALVCPISMVIMMAGMQSMEKRLFTCSECGLQYADNTWAQKCQAWCKEHKTCNIEITGHSITK